MATRTLTPGSYIGLAGLLLLALIIAVVSFIVPFSLYGAGSHDEDKKHGAEAKEEVAGDIDLMHAPESSSSSAAAQEFRERILTSYGGSDISVTGDDMEEDVEESETGDEESSDSSAVSGDEALSLMTGAGCLACHQAADQGVAAIGPSLNGVADRVASYDVDLSPEEYIRESIINPSAFLSPECPPNGDPCLDVMAATFADTLSESDLDTIVDYLVTLPAQ